jgi:uncharacterized protein (TIGR02569 family)
VDAGEWTWVGEHLASIQEEGFRLAAPVRASDGSWTVAGWGATAFVEGAHAERWLDVLAVGDAFHARIRRFKRPSFLDARTHPWAVADRVAWEESPSPVSSSLLDELVSLRRPVRSSSQVVHGDLTENVLFADGEPPAIIDISPYYRPAGYASGILIGDAVRWRGADPAPLLEAARHHSELPQLLIRASIFRLVGGSPLRRFP